MIAPPQEPLHSTHERRRSARLAGVQALYQMELTGEDAGTVAQEFVEHRFSEGSVAQPDETFFRAIVDGVPHRQTAIDHAIAGALREDWRLQRIDSILRAILRAAAYELVDRPDIPARVVMDEYIEITRRFSDQEQCAFVNAVLDRIARAERAAEFLGAPRHGDAAN
ncbi:MAG TPA: transcription antitermination factor NusB [Rhizomicrobium sp.]|jgi:N utilization substance protein B|nr:transcription antitermination factor NusB [Rhizomicrobium sp.]